MTPTATNVPTDSAINIEQSIDIEAPIEVAFDALIAHLGPRGRTPDGTDMSFQFEPRPGGRWYRDLGNDTGHLWGLVQVIKPPTLLEIAGPLFMSYPVLSHLQYRLTPNGAGTTLSLTHRAIGMIDPEHREGVSHGWECMLGQVKSIAESG